MTIASRPTTLFSQAAYVQGQGKTVVGAAFPIIFHDGSNLAFHDGSDVAFHNYYAADIVDFRIGRPRTVYSGEVE